VLIEEVDAFGFEPFERFFGNLADTLPPAVQTGWLSVLELGPELRGNDHLVAKRKKCFAHEFFVVERAVDFCGIEYGTRCVPAEAFSKIRTTSWVSVVVLTFRRAEAT
jgi:hypothetical protein